MDEIALLRELDRDEAAVNPAAKHAARSALRAHIVAAQQATAPAQRATAHRRWSRLRMAGAVAVVLVVAMVAAVVIPDRGSRPAYAATPPLLMPTSDAGTPAKRVLERLAAAAEAQPPLAGGRYHYLRSASWYLQTTVYNENHAESVIVPAIVEQWRSEDGSGKTVMASGEPVEAGPPGADADRRAVDDLPIGEGEVTEYAPGELSIRPTGALPRDPDALREKLLTALADNERPEHVQIFVELEDLLNQRVPPDLLAAFYRVFAEDAEMRSYGPVTDRAGRRGVAIGFDSDYAGLPTRYLLIVDPQTGTPLGIEEILTTDPGKLGVRVPAVMAYIVYLAGGDVASTEHRAPAIP